MSTSIERSAVAPDPAFGRRVRTIRMAKGLTQAQLAGPYSRAYISLLEAGGIEPSSRALQTLAERLGVDLRELEVIDCCAC